MNKNKYLVFISIGLELVSLIIISIYLGDYLVKKKEWPEYFKAIFILVAFTIWFVSLMIKLKALNKKND